MAAHAGRGMVPHLVSIARSNPTDFQSVSFQRLVLRAGDLHWEWGKAPSSFVRVQTNRHQSRRPVEDRNPISRC
jgi:hypothetical protein